MLLGAIASILVLLLLLVALNLLRFFVFKISLYRKFCNRRCNPAPMASMLDKCTQRNLSFFYRSKGNKPGMVPESFRQQV